MDPNNPNNPNNPFDPNAQNTNYGEPQGQDQQQSHDDYVHQLEQQQHEEMLREQQQQQQFSAPSTPAPYPPEPSQAPQPPEPVQHHNSSTPYPDTEYRTPYPANDPFNPSESNLGVTNPANPFGDNTSSSPSFHRPEPHLPIPDSNPFQADSRRSSLLTPTDSAQIYGSGTFAGLDDPYSTNYDASDNVPLTNLNAQGNLPYPDTGNNGAGGGFLNRFKSTRRPVGPGFSDSQYSNINPQYLSPTPMSDNDGDIPIAFNTGFRDLPNYPVPNLEGANAYFPYPAQDTSFPGARLSMPDPNSLLQDDLIEESWNMRQHIEQADTEKYTKREVNLINGIYSVEFPVPSPVKSAVETKYRNLEDGSTEFTHMRYTACTCDPDEFKDQNYTLRAAESGRRTELLIAVTYYSEDKILTARTLTGIMKNVHHFCADKSQFWRNEDGEPWQKIVVTLIMDGIKPCRKDVLDVLASMGVYQDGVMKKAINNKETVAHIFEYTSQVCFTPDLEVITPSEGSSTKYTIPPIQYVLCLKQENSKKINSHRWLFNAFGAVLNPNVCVLIDAGTKPSSRAIVHLWRAFYNSPNVGGACGEIHAMLGKRGKYLLNPLVAAQNFEYKLSNQLDKPLEDTFGFISVLPGAFSAYRFEALQGRPLEQYFRGDHSLAERLGDKGLNGMNIFKRNMFLAEDRILCFEITFKAREKWHLKYVKASKAETDVPEEIDEFISQRRRWINGSFAATLYSMMHFGQIYRTGHNLLRTFFMHIQLFYNFINIIMTWFSLASYYLTTTIILELAANPNKEGSSDSSSSSSTTSRVLAVRDLFVTILERETNSTSTSTNSTPFPFKNYHVSLAIALIIRFIYMLIIIISFLLALGNRPKGAKKQFTTLFILFGVIQFYALVVAIYLCTSAFNGSQSDFFETTSLYGNARLLVIIALVSTYGLYIYAGIIYLDPWHLIHSFIQYSFIMPSFTTVINVFAFCNWHDVSWGTKGADKPDHIPSAVTKTAEDGTAEVVEEYERPQDDIDTKFLAVMERAKEPYKHDKDEAKKKPDPDDESRTFRTNLIILWILCNVVLAAALTSQSVTSIGFSGTTDRSTVYFFILIIITALMAGFRMIGCTIFVVKSAIARGFGKK